MTNNFILVIFLFILASSCCGGEEVGREEMSEEERSMLPYDSNSSSTFIHNEGYQFTVEVIVSSSYSGPLDDDCSDYIARENRSARFTATLPHIELTLKVIREFNDSEDATLQIYSSRAQFERLDGMVFSQTINGTIYNDLNRYTSSDPTSLQQEILISAGTGIVQITYLNGNYVQRIN